MTTSKIEWTDRVWNPVTGCTKISAGCRNCYAERLAGRKMGHWAERDFSEVRCHSDRLDHPLNWKKPSRIFVNSMSDLFHEDVPFVFALQVWRKMAEAHWHTFQVLTKRPKRMLEFFQWMRRGPHAPDVAEWERTTGVLPNVWLGVSVEHQAAAEERIPLLLQCPAAVRFLSCEPLLGPVEIFSVACGDLVHSSGDVYDPGSIDWVIVGGESGPGARPCAIEWVGDIIEQCRHAHGKVPVFVKQLGAFVVSEERKVSKEDAKDLGCHPDGWAWRAGTKDKKGADDTEWPEYLRVREFPAVSA